MQLHNILITDKTRIPSSFRLSQNDSLIELDGSDAGACLTDYLSSVQLPVGTSINLVLDQSFIRYHYFNFPLISTRKLQQVLKFELEDILLRGSEDYVYTYHSRSSKKSGITEAGVFTIEKPLFDSFISVFKLFNLELRWITSLENLVDLAFHENGQDPGSSILIDLTEKAQSARFYAYQSGFLTGVSLLQPLIASEESGDGNSTLEALINKLNQKITAILLAEPDHSEIVLSGNHDHRIGLDGHHLLPESDLKAPSTDINSSGQDPWLRFRPDHPRRINLIRSNILIIQELKKVSRSLIAAATLVFCSLTFYLAAVAYRGYNDHITIQALDKRMTETVSRYLPRGTSKTNAPYILKERIQTIENEKAKSRSFEQRRYQIVQTLSDLSLLKEGIPSLNISRFSLNDQVIRFKGQTDSINEFDQIQDELRQLYPADQYRINTSEKSQGTGAVTFSTTIQKK